ncbi:Glucose/sorbosone dehydrogenase [Hahella chejuensis KCTC 2396]|uniref:Glucose/sorbosone dehydrogenase n=2 Tax=Hahella chejuensis TaxID=158327 RepID=Q2S7S8_HAHCH|nr:Glucose/sorbosone dehydrogenase [Hahella chejuensis KCTC 2396]
MLRRHHTQAGSRVSRLYFIEPDFIEPGSDIEDGMKEIVSRALRGLMLVALLTTQSAEGGDKFKVETVLQYLDQPWSMAFLPDGGLLVTQKTGDLLRINLEKQRFTVVKGAPESVVHGQGGLLDVMLHPDFESNHWIYLTFTQKKQNGYTTALARGRLEGDTLAGTKILLSARAVSGEGQHFGSRMAFDDQGLLYMTIGDRGDRRNAQNLQSHAGKVLCLTEDGAAAPGNPFLNRADALPEIFSYGHRNPQGLTYDSVSQRLWLHEHGPKGGDEVNLVQAGKNYGWPLVTYGKEYWGGTISEQTEAPGVEKPVWYWDPSIAPSGMAVYRGDMFPQWRGDLLVGALKFQLLARVEMNEARAQKEERFLQERKSRIRDVRVGPDGAVYVLTDGSNAELLRLSPAD